MKTGEEHDTVAAVRDSLLKAIAGEEMDAPSRVALVLADTLGLLAILASAKRIRLPPELPNDLADHASMGAVRVLKEAIARTRNGVTPQV